MSKVYHYTGSGLDNVYLLNGFKIHKTPYGEGVSIEDIGGLHAAIGRWLIGLPKLTGAEFRFLRLEMELSQAHLAGLIGSTEQNVQRWERARDKDVQGPADRLLRMLYREYVEGRDQSVRRMVDRLAALDQIQRAKIRLRHKADWEPEDYQLR